MVGTMQLVRRLVAPLARRVYLMLGRALLTAIDDVQPIQRVSAGLLAGEHRDLFERLQSYGFTAVPLPGAEAIVASLGGSRAHLVALVVDDRRWRPTGLAAGETAMYSRWGQLVHMDAAGVLHITAPNGIVIETPADVVIRGDRIKRSADSVDQWDVNGWGLQRIWTGTEWRIDTWQDTPLVAPGAANEPTPPELEFP